MQDLAGTLQAGKRPMMPKTPQPPKKAKVDAKGPKSAPAKMGKGILTPLARPITSGPCLFAGRQSGLSMPVLRYVDTGMTVRQCPCRCTGH